jgi:AraC-like DNA-binding protein
MLHKTLIKDIRILSGGPYEDDKDSVFPLHKHNIWELVYYYQGSVDSQIDGIHYQVSPGIVLLTPPGEAHSDRGVTAYKNYYMGLDIAGDPHQPSRRLLDDANHSLRDCCRHIVHELASQHPQREEMLCAHARQLRILIERANQRQGAADDYVLQVHEMVAYMSEHISEPLKIADIAAHFHCAVSTMRDWFYKVYACSPQQYLGNLRFDQARQLIAGSNLKLTAVARTCGYDSLSHMSRVVKQRSGMSPGVWRQDMQR